MSKSTSDFSHLSALNVDSGKTVEYPIPEIQVNGKSPTLILASATEANKPYFNELLKRAAKTAKAIKRGSLNADMLAENREEDKELYPKHVIKGWRDMLDAAGQDSPFHRENCELFIQALPDWLFDDIRTFCTEPSNLVEMGNIEVASKN